MKLGIERTVMVRTGIGHTLPEAIDEGQCGLPEEELGPLAAKLLEVPAELIRTTLHLELADDAVVTDTVEGTPCKSLGGLHGPSARSPGGCWDSGRRALMALDRPGQGAILALDPLSHRWWKSAELGTLS